MGIFSFFRKKKPQEPEAEPEKIFFEGIPDYLDKKEKEFREKEKAVFEEINQKINEFISDLNIKLEILEEVDVDAKKVEDRAKNIVKESLGKYLAYTRIFVKALEDADKKDLGGFVEDVNKIFADFEKHSYGYYEKATYLIGKEILAVKKEIVGLNEYFSKLFEENDKIIYSLKAIADVRLKLKEIDEIDVKIGEVGDEVKDLHRKISDGREREKSVLDEIEEIKVSDDYAENLKRREEIKLAEEKLGDEILGLKEIIDFKKLSGIFHADDRKMGIVKDYKENFRVAFEKGNGEDILKLIEEGEMNSVGVVGRIGVIWKLRGEIEKSKKIIRVDGTKKLSEEIEKLKDDVNNLIIKKGNQNMVKDKHNKEKEEVRDLIKEKVEGLNAHIVSLRS